MPAPTPTLLTRRALLAAVAVLAVAGGCTTGAPRPAPKEPEDPIEGLLEAHLALRAAYDVALAAVTGDPRLSGLRDNTHQQLAALAAALARVPPPSTSPTSSGPAPADASGLVAALTQRETALAGQCRELAIVQSASRAPLLASLAASHAAAAEVLA